MRHPASLLLIVAAVTAISAQPFDVAQGKPDPYADAWQRLDEVVATRMRAANTPGLALAVTSRDRLLHVATYGLANLDAKTPVAPDTLFEIGSVSKSFTSIALLQLHDEGAFDPQAPIAKYLPWFSIRTTFAPITGHHLMSHTSALPRDRDDVPSSPFQAYALREREAGYAPGTHYAYSNVGYQTLGYALEAIAKQPYHAIIESRIMKPLGMHASAARFTHATRPRLAVGYERMYDDRPSHPSHPLVPATWLEYGAGDGSIVSTPADMAAYARMLLNRGKGPDGRRILSEKGFELLTQRATASGQASWYGYGVGTSERDTRVFLRHSGGMVGYSSMLMLDPEAGVGAVAMVNGPGDAAAVVRFAVDVAREASRGQPLSTPPPADDPARVPSSVDYDGTYIGSGGRTLTIRREGDRLSLLAGGAPASLERRGRDAFFVHHPDFDRFLLRFERQNGAVVAVAHGADWYAAARHSGPAARPHPKEWSSYPGHYRTTHAWFNNFRIVARRGTLYLVSPDGGETRMESIGDGLFKEEGTSSERLRFDSIVDGHALRANLSGVDYYRVFTP